MGKSVLVYNPTCELAVQHDTLNYQPPKHLIEFERKLAPLMMFLAEEGDCLVCEKPSDDILDYWRSHGVTIPRFVSIIEARSLVASGYILRPWGVSREVLYRFGGHALADGFSSEHRYLFSRLSSVALDDKLASFDLPSLFVQDVRPRVVRSADELSQLVYAGPCVVKSLWSASGRGVSMVNKEEFRDAAIGRFSSSIRRDGAVVVEPLLNREVDLALLFFLNADGRVDFLGKNFYRSDAAGRFGVELIGHNPLQPFIDNGEFPADGIDKAVEYLKMAISAMNWNELYTGPIGVDSMLYRDDEGHLKMRLCIEANVRYTMGNVNLAVARCFPQGARAEWGISDSDVLYVIKAVLDCENH